MGLLDRTDLVASYFTLTGAHMAMPPRHSLAERARAAAAAGFTGMALAPQEWRTDVADLVGDVPVPELEPLKGWDSGERTDEAAIFALAGTFGSRQVTTIQLTADVPEELLAERFAGLCTRAAEHGLRVGFEPRAGSPVSTPAQAARVIRASGATNAGIVLDAYHVHRAGVTLDDLAPFAGMVASVQLNDMLAEPRPDPAQDALEFRLAPGAGAIDLPGWLAGLDRMGVDVPLSVETMCRAQNALDARSAAERAVAGARAALAAARAR